MHQNDSHNLVSTRFQNKIVSKLLNIYARIHGMQPNI